MRRETNERLTRVQGEIEIAGENVAVFEIWGEFSGLKDKVFSCDRVVLWALHEDDGLVFGVDHWMCE
jgi:hypothetical protein